MSGTIDILVNSARWRAQPRAKRTIRAAIDTAAAATRRKNFEVSVMLTHDRAIRVLNHEWRGFDKATNVLSFPAAQAPGQGNSAKQPLLGDIVIAYETLAREAKAEHKAFLHHLSHLTVHGFLHLIGYDHVMSRQAETMEALERRILARLGIADPYADAERSHA